MIGYIPAAYPEEIFYSLCARFSDRTQYTNKKTTINRLFGSRNVIPTVELPSCLEHFVNVVGFPELYDADSIIQSHTLLPLYARFIPNNRLEEIKKDMLINRGMGLYMKTGLMADGLAAPSFLRYCPICSAEDRKLYVEFYWHRIHQVTGVLTCPVHNVFLEDSRAKRTGNRTRHQLLSANSSIDVNLPPPRPTSDSQKILGEISRDLFWLLTNAPGVGILEEIGKGYLLLLRQKDLAHESGRLRVDAFLSSFTDFFGSDLLRTLGVELTSAKENWLLRMFHKANRSYPPLQHVLLMQFLGCRAEQFFEILAHTSPHPVTKPSTNTTVTPRKLMVTHQADWEERLQCYWKDPSLSLRQMARLLEVDPLTVKRHAIRLGLSFPRSGNKCAPVVPEKRLKAEVKQNAVQALLPEYRKAWLDAMSQNPGMGTKGLRKRIGRVYTWLYRHDRAWLKKHQPPRLRPEPYHKVDWKKRDEEIAGLIPHIVNQILEQPGKPIRISQNEIGRRLGKLVLIQKHIEKLPKTKEAISGYVESRILYGIRRIYWAKKCFAIEKIKPELWEIVKRSGTYRLKKYPQVIHALQESHSELTGL